MGLGTLTLFYFDLLSYNEARLTPERTPLILSEHGGILKISIAIGCRRGYCCCCSSQHHQSSGVPMIVERSRVDSREGSSGRRGLSIQNCLSNGGPRSLFNYKKVSQHGRGKRPRRGSGGFRRHRRCRSMGRNVWCQRHQGVAT